MNLECERDSRIAKALKVIEEYGGIDGAHHKQWVLDQVVRALTQADFASSEYAEWLEIYRVGGDYEWDKGIAP